MKLGPDFRELLTLFNESGVKYLIVGSYALATYGAPRYTKDLDVFYDNSPENARKLAEVITRFGFSSLGLTESDFTVTNEVIQLGYPPHRVDLMSSISGVDFAEAWKNRLKTSLDGIAVTVISQSDFVKNKRSTGRLSDLADLERLGEVK